jgi:hypothetical protein
MTDVASFACAGCTTIVPATLSDLLGVVAVIAALAMVMATAFAGLARYNR